MCQQEICPSNAIIMPHAKITKHAFMGTYANIYATYEVASINDVARITAHRQ